MADTDSVKASSRNQVSKRTFINKAGEYTSRVNPDSIGFKIDILDKGEVVETLEAKLEDFDQKIVNAAALFGFVTSVTNTFGGLTGGPVEEIIQAAQDRLATFLEGDWSSERLSGPRSSQLLEAVKAVREDAGKATTDEWLENFRKQLEDEEFRKSITKDDQVAAKLAVIKVQAAQRLAEKRAAKAKEAKTSLVLGD